MQNIENIVDTVLFESEDLIVSRGNDENKKYGMADIDLGTPPHCYTSMQTRLLDVIPESSVTIAIPVLESYCNPAGSMQGGYISAAFDNAFGPLCILATGTPRTTALNINTSYHRPIFPGDELIITATVQSKGRTMIHILAEAYNREKQLIATANTQYLILNEK
ncbi:MAG: PaaI family thioesterase [Syntrophomonadaceae bacterium]|nr:PaaI family thioesterase [Syntrophomonadaceae bacterium]MDD4561983.1 PaaI family thioesterase [Syntrophomonadaceae bacterium]